MTDSLTKRGVFEVLYDPDEDGALVGPFKAYEVGETLYKGYFTPGTRLKNSKTGEIFVIVGGIGHQQHMIVEGTRKDKTIGLPYYKQKKLRESANEN
ncbi:MAG: hypothetical protein GYA36_16190 [Veillonellaceae bacterium]|nr:hypothetical protein [Veillonellaceae bacterium]